MDVSVESLYDQVNDLRRDVEHDALHPGPGATYAIFADSPDSLLARFAELEPRARRVWNMQTSWRFDPDDPSFELNDQSWDRGVDSLIVTNGRTLEMNPVMMAHCGHRVWVGPALTNMILVNDELAVVEGIRRPDGFMIVMCSAQPAAVASVRSIFDGALALSTQAFPPGTTTLTRRQIQVARGMARGSTDARLAHELDVSLRTVEREVAAVLTFLDAHSRPAAVQLMSGRNFTTATP